MTFSIAISAAAVSVLILLGGCGSSNAPPGVAPDLAATTFPSGNNPSDHVTAATGFGLGPEDFKSNGGAFGPDQADP